jgi:hypothetical protein
MAKSATLSVLRAVLLGASILGATAIGAEARVGVTSATNGDPLGKPPTEPERILRIGLDVQADEVVTTGANDRAHLVFLDGTSLTVGPNARLTIDKFVFDPATKTGELAINASKGVLRLVGGKISKTSAITVTTPASTIGVRGGICLFDVNAQRTISTFAFGHSMTVLGQGLLQTVRLPGTQVITNFGAPPGPPTPAPLGSLGAQFAQLEGRGLSSSSGSSGGGQDANSANQGAQRFAQQANSGQGPVPMAPTYLANQPSGNQVTTTANNFVANTVSNGNTQQQQQQAQQQQANNQNSQNPGNQNPGNQNNNNGLDPTTLIASIGSNPLSLLGNLQPPTSGTRTTQTITGYVGGVIETISSSGVVGTRNPNGNGSDANLSISTNASNSTVSSTITVPAWDGSGNSANTATFNLGGSNPNLFTNDNYYAALAPNATITQNGSTSSVPGFTVLLSNGTLATASFFASQGVTPCTCQFLQWGLWIGALSYPSTSAINPGGTDFIFGAYVAGTVTAATSLPMVGSATYNGHMAGTVMTSTGLSLGSGSYSNTWNFASQSGQVTANFNGAGFSGNTSLISGTSNFSTPTAIPSSSGASGRSLMLHGSFFSANSTAAAYQGGRFQITGTNYQAGGIFAAQK